MSILDNAKELPVGADMSSDEGRHFKKDPKVNIISKEEFEERIQKVFHLLWKTLSKSFGPYGAPTLIYNYPYSHVTKDGYTIMKNLSMDASETLVDQAIADMAADICGRLNYSVGDGTTSAVIATNSIYQNYLKERNNLKSANVLPRDILQKYSSIKDSIIKDLNKKSRVIRSEDPNILYKNIYDVVYVSSNGDTEMTEYISSLYKELGCPAISCVLAPDGVTKKKLINGYKFDMTLTDKLYINSDDNTMKLSEADIVIYDSKVNRETYEKILVPLNNNCRLRGRHLIVAAPSYDEIALRQVISRDLNNEYSKNKDVNMVLTTYKAISAHTRRLIADFAVLTNTIIIDRPLDRLIKEELENGRQIWEIFNIDDREDIPNIKSMALPSQDGKTYLDNNVLLFNNGDKIPDNYIKPNMIENPIRLGYVKDASLGLKSSVFAEFFYDKNKFDVIYQDAKDVLVETEKKYQKLGTFNFEVSQAQERFYSLNLKMGIIEVGADSELSQKLLKDAVDDAIKAAASAYTHGVVNGCNVDLISIIHEHMNEDMDDVTFTLYNILYGGFRDVYKTVLSNAFDNFEIEFEDFDEYPKFLYEKTGIIRDIFTDYDKLNDLIKEQTWMMSEEVEQLNEEVPEGNVIDNAQEEQIKNTFTTSLHDLIIDYSIKYRVVYDVSTKCFTDTVINSTQTDEEILKATIDLISLLITGNQMVVTQKHNF